MPDLELCHRRLAISYLPHVHQKVHPQMEYLKDQFDSLDLFVSDPD